ncbi:MAG: adenylate/guanylate cyclase domain-containing protein [Actinomycetia bacterium]|nr:adenylate/guanylate cyclase domain-containing protein [Actinomycetes bacterium]
MNLFRSEDHVKRWPLYFQEADDYVMSVSDWAEVFSVSMFRKRLDADYLSYSQDYLEHYRVALLLKGKSRPAPDRVLLAVMFSDIVDSTKQAARLGDGPWRSLLEQHNQISRDQIAHFGGKEIKQTGDGFLSSFDSPTRAIRCAVAIRQATVELGLQVRTGIHSGECEILGDDIAGIAVHIAARVETAASPNEILATRTVVESVTGSGIDFTDQGKHDLKGVPGTWNLHAVDISP